MKDWAYLTTVEEMEQATNSLLENGSKVGADSWQQRVKNQTPHCGFGESGTCCRICSMGPCRITKKAPRGICGCDVHGIVGRNYLRFTAGGSATHSDHGREIMHTLYQTKEGGNYQVKDPEKLIRIAKEWGVETEGKDIYDLAHEMAEIGLLEYGKPFGVQRFLKRAPEYTQKLWHEAGIEPRAIDREVSTALHMTHMGCSSLPEALIRQALRAGLSDGWGGSMMGTEFSDVMFGTPKPIDTNANIGVMEKDNVNIVVHGHDPSLSEMVVYYANDPEMIAYAKSVGAKGITGTNTIYPIYDWKTADVWLYLRDQRIEVPEVYLQMYQVGVNRNQLRVSQFFSVDTVPVLVHLGEYDPSLMERVLRREPNAYLAMLYWDSEMFHRTTRKRRELEGEDTKDYRALLKEMLFVRPGDFFNTEHKRKIAKQYRKMFIQMDGMARPRDYKKMYGGLTAGDPKLRTLRAIYQDISCAYADYAKRFRKGGEANG